jgi:hypothetical protein
VVGDSYLVGDARVARRYAFSPAFAVHLPLADSLAVPDEAGHRGGQLEAASLAFLDGALHVEICRAFGEEIDRPRHKDGVWKVLVVSQAYDDAGDLRIALREGAGVELFLLQFQPLDMSLGRAVFCTCHFLPQGAEAAEIRA